MTDSIAKIMESGGHSWINAHWCNKSIYIDFVACGSKPWISAGSGYEPSTDSYTRVTIDPRKGELYFDGDSGIESIDIKTAEKLLKHFQAKRDWLFTGYNNFRRDGDVYKFEALNMTEDAMGE